MSRRALAIIVVCGPWGCDRASDPAGGDTSVGVADVELVRSYSATVRPGGTLYVVPLIPRTPFPSVSVDGRLLEPSNAHRDGNFALYELPADLPLGEGILQVSEVGSLGRAQHLPLEVIEPVFADVAEAVGLVHHHDTSDWPQACAEALTGVGFGDYDGDGDLDVYVGNIGSEGLLYRNDGDTSGDGLPDFTEATAEAGLSGYDLVANVSWVDVDDDGDEDLFLGRRGANRLLENRRLPDGEAVFVDASESWGLSDELQQRTMGSAWGDYDGDGDLDLYVLNHAWCFPDEDTAVDHRNADVLYRNDGGRFVDVTHLLPDDYGAVTGRFGFAGLWIDHDLDGDLDLFAIHDHVPRGGKSVVFRNDGPGDDGEHTFTNVTRELAFAPAPDALGKSINAMGVAVSDLNADGRPDFAYSNIGPNYLLVSDVEGGEPVYRDVSEAGGIQRIFTPWETTSVTWATHLFDWDNDGDVDVLYVGGDLKGGDPMPHAFFENVGDLAFVDRTWEAGLDSTLHGKGSSLVDLDGDGFLELVVANWDGPLEVYRNTLPDRGNANHWLVVDLIGDGERVTREPFGAVVAVTTPDGATRTCFHNPMPSLSGSGDRGCHFGLGDQDAVSEIEVTWPDGTVQQVVPVGVDRRLEVVLAP